MIAAVVALAIAVMAAIGGLIGISLKAITAQGSAGFQEVRATLAEGKLLAATLASDGWKARAGEQEDRANALQDLLQKTADDLPTDGARERMQARWLAIHHPATVPASDHATVPSAGPAHATGSDELLKPGD